MTPTNRIVVNTLVQYIRSIVYMLLALFSTRYILEAMGHSAYGVYAVIVSLVYMMGFITHSLSTSTQRFLSYSQGISDIEELRKIYTNAMFLHSSVAIIIVSLMVVLQPFCFSVLNIPSHLAGSSVFAYYCVLLMVVCSFVSSPIKALFIARENIIFVSLLEILDAVLKLVGAVLLTIVPLDALKFYALLLVAIALFNFFANLIYAWLNYEECRGIGFSYISSSYLQRLMGFAVWNVYAVGVTVARTQGLAVILNHFLGTIANAAYGIAQQMSNAAGFIALSILNAVNPQLMKAEGAGDRGRMLRLSMLESRYAFLTMALILIPIIVEMEEVLHFWLGAIPQHAVMFCRYILIAYIIDQLTIGLTSANQAIGKIRNYSLLVSNIRILILPIAWACLYMELPSFYVMLSYLCVESLIGVLRIPYMKSFAGLSVDEYFKMVFARSIPPVVGCLSVSYLFVQYFSFPYRFMATEFISLSVGITLVYVFALDKSEKTWIREKFTQLKSYI